MAENNPTLILPYASELFGIYQPLLGWKSLQIQRRTQRLLEQSKRNMFLRNVSYLAHSERNMLALHDGNLLRTRSGSLHIVPDSFYKRRLIAELKKDKRKKPDIHALFSDKVHNVILKDALDWTVAISEKGGSGIPTYALSVVERFTKSGWKGETLKFEIEKQKRFERSVATYVKWLVQFHPDKFNEIVDGEPRYGEIDFSMVLPSESFSEVNKSLVMSPVGIIHLFRQYFFEFDTFPGSPVGHFWLPPGGSLELVEVHTRRVVTERSQENSLEQVLSSEQNLLIKDEISELTRDEKKQDIKLGFSSSAKYTVPTFEGNAAVSLDFNASKSSARETAHKTNREQSEKLSSLIKQSFKSTFKVSVDDTEVNSRRYVLQNTSDKMQNYELKRKMRRVGVQLQDIGTQLCWQVFVDEPGKEIGISKMIHVAEPKDLSSIQPPTAPVLPEPVMAEKTVQFAFEAVESDAWAGTRETYFQGNDGEGETLEFRNDQIVWKRKYKFQPPAPGYKMESNLELESQHSGILSARAEKINADGEFNIFLDQVNFNDQPQIVFNVKSMWTPPDQQNLLEKYNEQLLEYNAEKERQAREAMVLAAKERVSLASNITKRSFDDLRNEERIVVFRKLIHQLFGENGNGDRHLVSELIRSIFDVDKMLYFVAPEWWQPRMHHHQSGTGSITDDHTVTWGGFESSRENNYYITADSRPAPMGSSLGWLLQLDGDNFRNAFLNSPWVKAVVPVKPGKEKEALEWLSNALVEGSEGLDALYDAPQEELLRIKPEGGEVSLRDALYFMAAQLQAQHDAARLVNPESGVLPSEKVFEKGFEPLQGSFVLDTADLSVFSQWTEILPTDQVIAQEYIL